MISLRLKTSTITLLMSMSSMTQSWWSIKSKETLLLKETIWLST